MSVMKGNIVARMKEFRMETPVRFDALVRPVRLTVTVLGIQSVATVTSALPAPASSALQILNAVTRTVVDEVFSRQVGVCSRVVRVRVATHVMIAVARMNVVEVANA